MEASPLRLGLEQPQALLTFGTIFENSSVPEFLGEAGLFCDADALVCIEAEVQPHLSTLDPIAHQQARFVDEFLALGSFCVGVIGAILAQTTAPPYATWRASSSIT